MNSTVIKFVAGAGKTTRSLEYLKDNPNGIYLAFNNNVVNEVKYKGYLSKTIDSFFESFVFPRIMTMIPLIPKGAKIKRLDIEKLSRYEKGIAMIKIARNGKIYNRSKKTNIDLSISNVELHKMKEFTNEKFIKRIFTKKDLYITDQHRGQLAEYIMENYRDKLIQLVESRFSYVIIDEAQDLSGFRQEFAKILYESNIKLILLGDDNQNISGGGDWFESLEYDKTENKSFRCPDNNCKWIRENLNIDIIGLDKPGSFNRIKMNNSLDFDNGERFLLYPNINGINGIIVRKWKGKKGTIKGAKGSTIDKDIVIIGKKINKKSLYTAITRTTKNCYLTADIPK